MPPCSSGSTSPQSRVRWRGWAVRDSSTNLQQQEARIRSGCVGAGSELEQSQSLQRSSPPEHHVAEQYERQGSALYSSARLWDDGVIEPRHTRQALALSLSACLNAPVERGQGPFGIFRM